MERENIKRIEKKKERETRIIDENLREEVKKFFENIQEKGNKKIKKRIGYFLEKLKEREVEKDILFSLLKFLTEKILKNPNYELGRFTLKDERELNIFRKKSRLNEREREKLKSLELKEKFFQIRLKLANLITKRDIEKEYQEKIERYEQISQYKEEIESIKGIEIEIKNIEAQIKRMTAEKNLNYLTSDEKLELKKWRSRLEITLNEKKDMLSFLLERLNMESLREVLIEYSKRQAEVKEVEKKGLVGVIEDEIEKIVKNYKKNN